MQRNCITPPFRMDGPGYFGNTRGCDSPLLSGYWILTNPQNHLRFGGYYLLLTAVLPRRRWGRNYPGNSPKCTSEKERKHRWWILLPLLETTVLCLPFKYKPIRFGRSDQQHPVSHCFCVLWGRGIDNVFAELIDCLTNITPGELLLFFGH